MIEKANQSQADHDLLDYYRDNNVHTIYRCLVCGFRGLGPSVTLHNFKHGPMVREEIKNRER
jgi:hypothetical protein